MADLNFFARHVCGYVGNETDRQEYLQALRMSEAQLVSVLNGCAGGSALLAQTNQSRLEVLQQQQAAQATLPACPHWARTIVGCRETNRKIDRAGYIGEGLGAIAGWYAGSKLGHPLIGSLVFGFIGYSIGRFYMWPKGGSW